MIHFSVFLVTAIAVAICVSRLGTVAPIVWRVLVAIAIIALISFLILYSVNPAWLYRVTSGTQSLPLYVVDLALGGVAGFVGGTWMSVHRMLRFPEMLGDQWLPALESRYRFLTLVLAGIVAIQLVIPHLELWLSQTTGFEIAGLIKLQVAPTASQGAQSNPSFARPASSVAPSEVDQVQQALDTVMSIASLPALETAARTDPNTVEKCDRFFMARSVCDNWNLARSLMLNGRSETISFGNQDAYANLPIILRDLAQISFLASKDEAGFKKVLEAALVDGQSPTWFHALKDNYLFFDHMNGILGCVETYSKTLRDLRLQLLDSHELVRALTLLASNPMGLSADRQAAWRQQDRRSANEAGGSGDGQPQLLTQKQFQSVVSWVIELAGGLDVQSIAAPRDPKEFVKNSHTLLDEANRLLKGLNGTPFNNEALRNAVATAELSVAQVDVPSNPATNSDKQQAIERAKADAREVYDRIQRLANDMAGLALAPWQRVTRRVDQSLTEVFERSAGELWVYGQGAYRDYELWTWAAGPMPTTGGSGRECGYSGFDVFRNGLISFLGGRKSVLGVDERPIEDLLATKNIARSLEFAPYSTLAAANLFAGIGGKESGVALLTRWLDQVPRNYWESTVDSKEPAYQATAAHAADVWLPVRAFSGLNNILEQDARNTVSERFFAQLLGDVSKALATAKPDVKFWFNAANCGIAGETPLYRATAQFFYFYYMTLRHRESELADRSTFTNDGSTEVFIDNDTVDELKRYMNLPDLCLSTVKQFTEQGDGWRGSIGVTLAQRLARRGLSKQWAAADAGIRHPDVVQARRIFIDSEAMLARAAEFYDRKLEKDAAEAAKDSRDVGFNVSPGVLEVRLLGGRNPWTPYRAAARTGIEALGDAAAPR